MRYMRLRNDSASLRDLGLKVAMPHRTFATVDHIIPTDQLVEPYRDPLAQVQAHRRGRYICECSTIDVR